MILLNFCWLQIQVVVSIFVYKYKWKIWAWRLEKTFKKCIRQPVLHWVLLGEGNWEIEPILKHNGLKFWKTFQFYAFWNRYICSWKQECFFRSHFNPLLKSWDQDRTFNKMQYTACLVLRAYFQLATKYAETFETFETYVIFKTLAYLKNILIRSFMCLLRAASCLIRL